MGGCVGVESPVPSASYTTRYGRCCLRAAACAPAGSAAPFATAPEECTHLDQVLDMVAPCLYVCALWGGRGANQPRRQTPVYSSAGPPAPTACCTLPPAATALELDCQADTILPAGRNACGCYNSRAAQRVNSRQPNHPGARAQPLARQPPSALYSPCRGGLITTTLIAHTHPRSAHRRAEPARRAGPTTTAARQRRPSERRHTQRRHARMAPSASARPAAGTQFT